jgi:hypothetical protein
VRCQVSDPRTIDDRHAVRELIENWAVWRDAGDWETELGFEVKRDMPGLTGPEVEDLYRRGAEWLRGG